LGWLFDGAADRENLSASGCVDDDSGRGIKGKETANFTNPAPDLLKAANTEVAEGEEEEGDPKRQENVEQGFIEIEASDPQIKSKNAEK